MGALVTITPTQDQVAEAITAFALSVLTNLAPEQVVEGLNNRVPEPPQGQFVVFTPLRTPRLSTNLELPADDCVVQASIAGSKMTVTSVVGGTVEIGAPVIGPAVAVGTYILQAISVASDGTGTYQVTPTQTVAATTLYCGVKQSTQSATMTYQFEFHAPDNAAGDMAMTFSTLFRDTYATAFFAALPAPLNQVGPLHADEPRQLDFQDAEQQNEFRWILEVNLQVDFTVGVAVAFADSTEGAIKDVDAVDPP